MIGGQNETGYLSLVVSLQKNLKKATVPTQQQSTPWVLALNEHLEGSPTATTRQRREWSETWKVYLQVSLPLKKAQADFDPHPTPPTNSPNGWFPLSCLRTSEQFLKGKQSPPTKTAPVSDPSEVCLLRQRPPDQDLGPGQRYA